MLSPHLMFAHNACFLFDSKYLYYMSANKMSVIKVINSTRLTLTQFERVGVRVRVSVRVSSTIKIGSVWTHICSMFSGEG